MNEEAKTQMTVNTAGAPAPGIVKPCWKSLFVFTTYAHITTFTVALLLTLGSGIVTPALAYFLGLVFDSFVDYTTGKITGEALVRKVSVDALYLVILGSVSWILKGSFFSFWIMFGELQAKSARDKIYEGLLQKKMDWFDTRKSGINTMIPRLQAQIRELQMATSQPLGFALQYLVTTFAALGLAFYFAWDLTLITIATLPVGAFVITRTSVWMQPAIESQLSAVNAASKIANNSIHNIEMVKCFNGQNSELWRYTNSIQKGATYYLSVARGNAFQIGFVRFLMLTMFVQGFWYGSHIVVLAQQTSGQVLTVFWACLMATQTIEQILPLIIVLEKGRAVGATLEAVLLKMEREQQQPLNESACRAPDYCDGDIAFHDVTFTYPSRPNNPALSNVNLFFPSGETTFVVGKSGSGKSTLSNLLLQFYSPDSGTITLDGNDLKKVDCNWLRNNITLLQQDTVLFNETMLRNIVFGRADYEHVGRNEIKIGIEVAGLMETIFSLPNGIETLLGSGGTALSGGQRQRVALARARLRDTPVLVLDEATSALDQTSRIKVMEEVRKWRAGKTTIIITHDLSQILKHDYIYVVANGRIVQEGYRNSLTESTDGPLTGFLAISTTSPDTKTDGNHASLSTGDITPPCHAFSSPRPSMDSIDAKLSDKSTVLPKASYPSHGKHKQQPIDLVASLAPMAVHMRRLPGTRASMQSLHNMSRLQTTSDSRNASIRHIHSQEPALPTATKDQTPQIQITTSSTKTGFDRYLPVLKAELVQEHPAIASRSKSSSIPKDNSCNAATLSKINPVREILSLNQIMATVWPNLKAKHRIALVAGFVSAAIHAGATPVFSWIFSKLLSTFFLPLDQRPKKALIWSMSILGIAAVDAVASFMMHYLLEIAGQAWVDGLRIVAMRCILDQPRSWFDIESNSIQDLVLCLDRCAEEMRNLIGRFLGFIFVAIVVVTIALTWCLCICWKLTLVGAATAPVLYSITRRFEMTSGRWEGKSNEAGDAAGTVLAETFGNIRSVRALTLESYFHRKFSKATAVAFRVGLKRAVFSGVFFGVSDASVMFTTALVFWYGSQLASNGEFQVQSIITVITMLLFSIANVNAIMAFIPQINSSRDTATQLLRLVNLPYWKSYEHFGQVRLSSLPGSITFKNFSFKYPTRPDRDVLSSINLEIALGKSTALVGPSGSGKSTIVSLIMGLYPTGLTSRDSKHSRMMVGKHSFLSLHLETLRSCIGYVPQQMSIFPGTIAANITYGLESKSPFVSQSSVSHAASMAGADRFINSLPGSYATIIGEGGTTLSGGQVQRLAIARAIVRRPELLIMDEPTSSLDAESAEEIRVTIADLVKGGMTVLMVTHSPEMMKVVDQIIVLEDGRVVDEGRWQDLIAKEGTPLRKLLGSNGLWA